jgi:glycosyltransferase involved in cell wall biosynthesis
LKIGINATFLNENPTGIGIFTKEVSERLSTLQKNTVVFTSVPLKADVQKTSVSMRGSLQFAHNYYRFIYINTLLPAVLKRLKIEVLFCPIMEFPFIPFSPLVVTVHDLHPVYFSEQFGYSAIHFKFALKLLPFLARRVIVPSFFVKEELLKAVDLKDEIVDVVYEGYNAELFRPCSDEMKAEFSGRYGIKAPYLLFVGSLFPYKNVKTLLKSFMDIKNKIPHSLVIIGRKDVARDPLHEDERIIYLDYMSTNELPYFYSYADMLIHPSLFEGFGLTLLEAMACGTPVISSRGGSLPEVVGDAGIYFDPLDSAALSRLILEVVSNRGLRSELREKGFRQVRKFSWDRTAEGILKSCEDALKGKR